jgi:mono/diheme cytochrome c family protein
MRRAAIAWLLALGLAACASRPPTPDWQMNAHDSLARAAAAYLAGDTRIEAAEFERARANVARTGRADLLARLELARCAWRVASLQFEDCAGFAPLAQDAGAAERAYAAYLAGALAAGDAALLPETHRAIAAGGGAADALARIEDPVARLVAAGVLLRSGRATPAVAELAAETASAQGWRRPLLAWLGVQAMRADDAGASAEAAQLRRRIDLVTPVASRSSARPADAALAARYANAWRTLRIVDCARCHGARYEGQSGPSIVEFARTQSRERFISAIIDGNPGRGMPGYRSNELVVAAVDDMYAYFKARADSVLPADWRPASP